MHVPVTCGVLQECVPFCLSSTCSRRDMSSADLGYLFIAMLMTSSWIVRNSSQALLQLCLKEIKFYMSIHTLQLNSRNTKALLIGTPHHIQSSSHSSSHLWHSLFPCHMQRNLSMHLSPSGWTTAVLSSQVSLAGASRNSSTHRIIWPGSWRECENTNV